MRIRDLIRWLCFAAQPMYIIKNKAPDTSGVNASAVLEAQTAAESLAWAKNVYADEAPAREAAAALDQRVADSQIAGMDFATQEARAASERNKTVFQPMEDQLVADSQTFDTPERRAEAAARAAADVESAAGSAVADMNRDVMRRGGTVDDGGARGNALDLALGKARMRAGASDAAVRNVEQQGYARKMDAVGLGKGIVGAQATQQQIATQAGAGAVSANGAGLSSLQSGTPMMQQGFSQALAGYKGAGDLYGQAASIKNQARAQDLNFLSNVFSTAMKPSSKKIKKNIEPADQGQALDEINALDVADYDYDPKAGGPAGEGPQTGPMAEQTRAVMGGKVAPGGEMIDMKQMGGKLVAGMQALTTRMKRIEQKIGA